MQLQGLYYKEYLFTHNIYHMYIHTNTCIILYTIYTMQTWLTHTKIQGCGKSTLCEQLVDLFEFVNMRAASVSIDDFYLTNAHQQALAEANSTNGLLQYRGNAGSHDLQLGTDTLTALTAGVWVAHDDVQTHKTYAHDEVQTHKTHDVECQHHSHPHNPP